jgi:flagellum-specific peptidoglycan hydrolase FlgJ
MNKWGRETGPTCMHPHALSTRVWAGVLSKRYGYGMVDPWLIAAQAMLETGNFTSAIFRENRNLFGLKVPRQRPTFAIGENRGHAVFADHRDCIEDYFERQRYFDIPNTRNVHEYVNATVRSGYAEADNYAAAWMSRYDQLTTEAREDFKFVPWAIFGAALAIGSA